MKCCMSKCEGQLAPFQRFARRDGKDAAHHVCSVNNRHRFYVIEGAAPQKLHVPVWAPKVVPLQEES
jgi:hypothetical protein